MDEPLIPRVPPSGPALHGGADGYAWGADTVRETVTVLAAATPAAAAALPALARDVAGTPLRVTFDSWRPGSVLRVRWSGSAQGVLNVGAIGALVPRVTLPESAPRYIDNGSLLGLLGLGNLMYAFGECAIVLDTPGPVIVELGIFLVQGAPGNSLIVPGGPITLAGMSPVLGSTWLVAERLPSTSLVQVAPPAALRPLPLPT